MSKKKEDAAADAADAANGVKVRVLAACAYGQPNDVAAIDAGLVEQATADGLVDATPEAVAYAQAQLDAAQA